MLILSSVKVKLTFVSCAIYTTFIQCIIWARMEGVLGRALENAVCYTVLNQLKLVLASCIYCISFAVFHLVALVVGEYSFL